MAKDGTVRGGKRPGAGRKPKDLADKIIEGREATVLAIPQLGEPEDLTGADMPKVDEWLKESQQDGREWQAEKIAVDTFQWLRDRGCEKLVTMQQIYAYAAAEARWIQCHRAISLYGFLAKHPTTGAAVTSPYVTMADKFSKQAAAAWFSIFTVVRENCSETYDGMNPHESIMAGLLSD